MNIEHFIAKRIAFSHGRSFTKVIVRIAIAAVALSLAVMIVTMATINGFKNQITEKIFGFWGHIHLTDYNVYRTFEPAPISSQEDYLLTLADITELDYDRVIPSLRDENKVERIQTEGGVRHMQAFAITPGILGTQSEFEGLLMKGIDKDFDWDHMRQYLVDGEPIVLPDSVASDDIVISEITSQRLKKKVGDRILLSLLKSKSMIKRALTISGIYKTGLEEYDKRFALIDIREVQSLYGWEEGEVAGYEVFLDDIDDMQKVSDYIDEEMELPLSISSETIRSKFPIIFEWLELQNVNERVILSLMVIICVLNMITVLLILILERLKMIGTLKAIGSSDWTIRKIFLYQAAYIVGWGIVIGNVIGFTLCFLQKYFEIIKLNEKNYYLSVAPIEIDFPQVLLMNVISLIVVVLCLVIPTYLITRITPVQTLRFD